MSLQVIIKQGVMSQEREQKKKKNVVGARNTLRLTQNVTG